MATAERSNKRQRRAARDLLAGAAGLAAAAVLVLLTLRFQDYTTPAVLMVSLFVFPVPVACGLAVGLVSPRRAILWAPLWAFIFTMMLFALLHGGIHDARVALSPWRLAFMALGALLAAVAGVAGQRASQRGAAGRAVTAFVLLCGLMALGQYISLAQQMRHFQADVMPDALADVDRDYIHLPAGLDWRCDRELGSDCYRLSTQLRGDRLSVLVNAAVPRILGVNYQHKGGSLAIRDDESARAYLRQLGVREALLGSLSRQKLRPDTWCASLEGTRLTLSTDGRAKMEGLWSFSR